MNYLIYLDDKYANCGFCSLLRHTLSALAYAKIHNYSPSVTWGKTVMYHDDSMTDTDNVFNYYFRPIVCESPTDSSILFKSDDVFEFSSNRSYDMTETDLQNLGEVFCDYVKFNSKVENEIKKDIELFNLKKRILGIHIRGTDFKNNFNNHPISVSCEEIIDILLQNDMHLKYDYYLVASDEQCIVDNMTERLGHNAFSLSGIYRSLDGNPVHYGRNRNASPYKLGLDILREVYALSCCDGLLAGMSNVPMTAEILKFSRKEQYTDLNIVFHGRNRNCRNYLDHFERYKDC